MFQPRDKTAANPLKLETLFLRNCKILQRKKISTYGLSTSVFADSVMKIRPYISYSRILDIHGPKFCVRQCGHLGIATAIKYFGTLTKMRIEFE